MPDRLNSINRFVVVMLENRSFDHLFGSSMLPGVNGPQPGSGQNAFVPPGGGGTAPPAAFPGPGAPSAMAYDPGHEFIDVHQQLAGPGVRLGGNQAVPPPPAVWPMDGFAQSAGLAAMAATLGQDRGGDALLGFSPAQIPVLTALAGTGALFNSWFSPLPGPTWPNRFYAHASTSSGLTQSPNTAQIMSGYSFRTIYDNLKGDWRIYHDGLPQSAGIWSLRWHFINPFTENFRELEYFAQDVRARNLPSYTFIEPCYDTGNAMKVGNSLHPLNDVANGEFLLKQIYEALFAADSPYAADTMLIITFDEHGGFYDHVPPPAAPPPGGAALYSNPHGFAFDRYGMRVPAIAISPFTDPGTVIGLAQGADPATIFDHTSILATVAARFGLPHLSNRDASANTLACALTRDAPRILPATLPVVIKPPSNWYQSMP